MTNFNRESLHTRRRWFKFSRTTILYIISIQILLCSARPNQDTTNGDKPGETDAGVIKATKELPPLDEVESRPYPQTEETENTEDPERSEDSPEYEDLECKDEDEDCTEPPPNPHKPFNKFSEPRSTFFTTTERSQFTIDDENPPDETTTPVTRFNNEDKRPIDQPNPTGSTSTIQTQSTPTDDELQQSSTSLTISIIKIEEKARSRGLTVTNSIFISLISVLLMYFL